MLPGHPGMKTTTFRALLLLALASALAALLPPTSASAHGAKSPTPRAPGKPPQGERPREPDRLEKLAAEVVKATRDYRASLERLLAVYERELAAATELVEMRRDFYARGVISKREWEEGERALETARDNVEETRRWIAEADYLITEATVAEMLAKLAPLPKGGYEETAALIRYNGPAAWSLSQVPKIRRFFEARFGRALPVSAVGQTRAHDRIGFDHRNALDVAVHPDSSEGRAVMEFLRGAGIPFIAFRNAVAGQATGSHIHVGPPSRRIAARR